MLKGLLIVLGIGVLLWALSQRHRFLAVASAMRQAVGQQTPPPAGGTPAGHWWERALVRWALAIGGGLVLLGLLVGLLPGEWRNSIFTNPYFWLTVSAFVSYSFFAFAVMPGRWDDQAKKRVIRIARILLVTVLLLIGFAFAESQSWGPDSPFWGSLLAKVEDFSRPTPPPPVVWKGEKVVTLQPKGDWVVVEVPWTVNRYRLETGPNPDSLAEVSSPEWGDKAYLIGGQERESPNLPNDCKLRLRSREEKPITVKVMWR